MRTLIIVICAICALTNGLLFWDWADRGEHALAVGAILLAALALFVAALIRRLRF